jgi:hypothetical protein
MLLTNSKVTLIDSSVYFRGKSFDMQAEVLQEKLASNNKEVYCVKFPEILRLTYCVNVRTQQ